MRFARVSGKTFSQLFLAALLAVSGASDRQPGQLSDLMDAFGTAHIQAVPNDPLFGEQWGLQNTGSTQNFYAVSGADISAPRAWDVTTGDPSVIVAVIDTGIDVTHPDLLPNLWMDPRTGAYGKNFVSRSDVNGQSVYDPAEVDDLNGHGTAMSAIIAARGDNRIGISGVAWTGQVMALRAFDENGNTVSASGVSNAVSQAIDFAVANGARIINLSFGTFSGSDPNVTNSPEYRALVRARDAGVLVVAAACNEGQDNDANGGRCFPASFDLDNIIAVAATDTQDHIASFSNYGRINVDLAAPGEHILASMSRWNTVTRCVSANGVPLTGCGAINTGTSSVCRAVMSVSSQASGLQGGVIRWAEDSVSPIVNWSDLQKVSFVPSSATATTDVYADLRALSGHGGAYQILVSWSSQGVTTNSIEIQCRADGVSGTPGFFSGTSASAAFVSGAAALLLADDLSQDYVSLRSRLLNSVDALPLAADAERVATGGRLNIAAALGLPSSPAVAHVATTTVSPGGGGAAGFVLLSMGLWRVSRLRKATRSHL